MADIQDDEDEELKDKWSGDRPDLAITNLTIISTEELDSRVMGFILQPHDLWVEDYLLKRARRIKGADRVS